MRKKQILALLAMILFGGVALFMFEMNKGPAWPLSAVNATICKTVAADRRIGIGWIVRTNGNLLRNRHPLLDTLFRTLRRGPDYRDIEKYSLQIGSDRVWVTIHQTDDLVDSVEIDPTSPPSKLAERLRSDLTAAHLGLPCSITKH